MGQADQLCSIANGAGNFGNMTAQPEVVGQ